MCACEAANRGKVYAVCTQPAQLVCPAPSAEEKCLHPGELLTAAVQPWPQGEIPLDGELRLISCPDLRLRLDHFLFF